MRYKILLATTCRWFAIARLAMGLRNAGFTVEAVCPSGHPVSRLNLPPQTYPYHALSPLSSFRAAMLAAEPDLVIPCDDLATEYLHAIYRSAHRQQPAGSPLTALIERSLGDPASYPVAGARSSLIALAKAEGVRVPETVIVANREQLRAWLNIHGLPAVLKTNGSAGGIGVKIVHSMDEADHAFSALNTPPLAARVIKRAMVNQDINLLVPFLQRRRPLMNVQSFIRGHDATSAVACWRGRAIASLRFDVLHTWMPKGPASVLRVIDNPEMSAAIEKIVRKLNLSGLYGFDFMIEKDTGHAFLIEMNPRATQTCHLPLGVGRDLPAALWSALSGQPLGETKSVTDKNEIALFPLEWQRNPASHFLLSAYHDVPWDEPELLRACAKKLSPGVALPTGTLAQVYSKLPWKHD